MERCPACNAGQHGECFNPEMLSNPTRTYAVFQITCCCANAATETHHIEPAKTRRSLRDAILGGYKEEVDVRDRKSTGRKRAAQLYPIEEGMVCEWANLKYAGGGVEPVVGCKGNRLTTKSLKERELGLSPGAIHHGPDKDTLNNGPENVHRICQTCHNRWHALNDPYYGERPEQGAFLPLSGEVKTHDGDTEVEAEARAFDTAYWDLPKKRRTELNYRMEGLK